MLTLNEISQSIAGLLALPQVDENKRRLPARVLNPRRKKIKFFNLIKQYLESEPTEDFCKKEISRLNHRLTVINNQYPQEKQFTTLEEEKEFKKEFNKMWDVNKLKEQVKALKFIIK